MSDENQTAEASDIRFPVTLYRGGGHAGFAIGGWTFKFIVVEWDLCRKTHDPIFNGQMTLTNGSTGGSVTVPHVSGVGIHDNPDHYILSFHGRGEESLHGGPKFPVNVSVALTVNKKSGAATGRLAVGNAAYRAAATVKTQQFSD